MINFSKYFLIFLMTIGVCVSQANAEGEFGGGGTFGGAYGDYSNWNPPHTSNGDTEPGEYTGYGGGGGFSSITEGSAVSTTVGSITTCANVQSVTADGISGGIAGFQGNAGGSFSGGGQSFSYNPSAHSFSYECAGVSIGSGTPVDIAWPEFDIDVSDIDDPEEAQEVRENWYALSTRDPMRGRAGKNTPLFMNEHGICRKIDNTATTDEPYFVDVSSYENWETVHGVPAGGDPNGGFTNMANRSSLPEVRVCCSPVVLTICGEAIQTDYAEVGEVVSVFSDNGGFATVQCASNNNWVALSAHGICGYSGGGGGDPTPSGSGYHNPSTGGTISQSEFDSLDSDVQDNLTDSGYSPTSEVSTNAVGAADIAAAETVTEAEQAAADAEAQAEAERLAAEQAAQEAEEEAQEDDDDDD